MEIDKEMIDQLLIIAEKEKMLSEIIVWLKAKDLWENCKKDLSVKIEGVNSGNSKQFVGREISTKENK
jgi:uncharacterized protein YjaZ